ncbi:MAG: hypothetical protein AAB366_02580 [Patescibacteria group bacterium]
MKKINKTTYSFALANAIKLLKKNKIILDNIEFIALLGSAREKEYIPNYSDLDLLLIIKSDDAGAIEKNILLAIKNICAILSKKYLIKISFLTHTIKDFLGYVEYEYLRHYSLGRVLYGDKNSFLKFFANILSKKKPNRKELRRQMCNAIAHARFNLVRKYVSFNKFNTNVYSQQLLKLFIDNLFEISDWRLIADEIWCSSKKEIAQKISEKSNSQFKTVVEKSYEYRKGWNDKQVPIKELELFFIESIGFVNDCVRDLKKKI